MSNAGAYLERRQVTPTCPDLRLNGRIMRFDEPQQLNGHPTYSFYSPKRISVHGVERRGEIRKAHNNGLLEAPVVL